MLFQKNNFCSENYFYVGSEEELIQAFRFKDQKKLILPDNFRFPMRVRSYLTWKEPSQTYTYLIFKMPNWDAPKGVVFKRSSAMADGTGGLCNWCHAYGGSEEISMHSVAMSSTVSHSYIICKDLNCIEKIEDMSMLSGKNPEKYITRLYQKMEKLFESLTNHKQD